MNVEFILQIFVWWLKQESLVGTGMDVFEFFMDVFQFLLIVGAAAFTYYKFFREGEHRERIELDLEMIDLGVNGDQRMIEVGVLTENKGNVEHKYYVILLNIRGIKEGETWSEYAPYKPRMEFPVSLHKFNLVTKEAEYYFIRPKVKQRFPAVLTIPADMKHILVKVEFYYSNKQFHQSERAFKINE